MYKPEELVHRKLATLIGREPREKPRDIYDAGWLATERPKLIGDTDRTKLHEWLHNCSPAKVTVLKENLQHDPITGRVDADEVWNKLADGIQRLNAGPQRYASDRDSRNPGNGNRHGDGGNVDETGGAGGGPVRSAMAKHGSEPLLPPGEQEDRAPERPPPATLPTPRVDRKQRDR